MATFLMTWNPTKDWPWENFEHDFQTVRAKGHYDEDWRCKNSHVMPGDRLFLLKQGAAPRGIIGSGYAISKTKMVKNRAQGKRVRMCKARWEVLLRPTQNILPRARLDDPDLRVMHWDARSSGTAIAASISAILERVWTAFLVGLGYSPSCLPEEVQTPERYLEGASRLVSVNAFERNPLAREACIRRYGARCFVCQMSFREDYGEIGDGFIHVHHLRPLSAIDSEYEVNPVEDLRPVCPNCHAMVHRAEPPLSLEELRQRMARRRQ